MAADQTRPVFEWDEVKRQRNLTKHGIDFLDAVIVMLDRTVDVPTAYEGEVRRKATGAWGTKLITIVYTFRGQAIRIISARRAWKNEERAYRQIYGG